MKKDDSGLPNNIAKWANYSNDAGRHWSESVDGAVDGENTGLDLVEVSTFDLIGILFSVVEPFDRIYSRA